MKVKEASKRIGISRRTLQYYDDIHLVKANRIENNHRDYDDEQLEDIWRVMVLKEMGFELEEIRSLIHSDNINEVLKHKKNDIHKQISTLMEKMDFITYILDNGFPERPQSDYKQAILEIINNWKKYELHTCRKDQIHVWSFLHYSIVSSVLSSAGAFTYLRFLLCPREIKMPSSARSRKTFLPCVAERFNNDITSVVVIQSCVER